jgi:hypothetical protein
MSETDPFAPDPLEGSLFIGHSLSSPLSLAVNQLFYANPTGGHTGEQAGVPCIHNVPPGEHCALCDPFKPQNWERSGPGQPQYSPREHGKANKNKPNSSV